jgi:hypothetical protein
MLMYAVVLILVMIVSNNARIQLFIRQLRERFTNKPDDDAALVASKLEGGASDE